MDSSSVGGSSSPGPAGDLPDDLQALAEPATWEISEAETQAFEQAYREMFPRMYGLARQYLSRDDAYDVTQDTLAGMWKRWNRIPAEMRTVAFYLRAVHRRVLNEQRDRRRRDAVSERWTAGADRAVAEDVLRADMLHWELAEIVDKAVAAMPAARREVWDLIRANSMSYEDAAKILRVTKHTIRKQMSLALRQLRAALEEAGYAPDDRGGRVPPRDDDVQAIGDDMEPGEG